MLTDFNVISACLYFQFYLLIQMVDDNVSCYKTFEGIFLWILDLQINQMTLAKGENPFIVWRLFKDLT